jgi:hypothetical protein
MSNETNFQLLIPDTMPKSVGYSQLGRVGTERPQAPLRKIVSIVFDVRIDGSPNAGDDARYQADSDCKSPGWST